MAILSSVEQFLNNCKETITSWFSTWANTNIKGKYLPLTGGTITGHVYGAPGITDDQSKVLFATKDPSINKGERPTEMHFHTLCAAVDKSGSTLNNYKFGQLEIEIDPDGATKTILSSHKNQAGVNTFAELSVGWDADGNVITKAPTPTNASDNSTKIATTAWVNTRLNNVVSSINATGAAYILPTATANIKGGVRVSGKGLKMNGEVVEINPGSNLSFGSDGKLNATNTVYTHHTQSAISFGPTQNATLANGGTFQVPQIAVDGEGHTTSITARTMTLPKYAAGTGITISGNTISSTVASLSIGAATGTGNAVTSLSISNNKIVPNLGSKFSLDGHTHSGYAASNHNHDSVYSKTTHNHDSEYAAKSHTHSYAPLASPVLTGTPKAPTATAGTNTTQIATTAFVSTAVSNALSSVSVNLNLSAATVTTSSGSTYVSGNVGAVIYLFNSDVAFLIFPTGTKWLVVGYNSTDATERPEDNTPASYSRVGQVVTIASNATTTNRLLSRLLSGNPGRVFGFAIRVA